MKIRIPSKKVCEEFFLIYELYGCQKAVNYLTKHYGIRRMKIILDGRRVGNGYLCQYWENKAYFTKRALNKRNVLHELYHHIVEAYEMDISERKEEMEARRFVREILSKARG